MESKFFVSEKEMVKNTNIKGNFAEFESSPLIEKILLACQSTIVFAVCHKQDLQNNLVNVKFLYAQFNWWMLSFYMHNLNGEC